MNYLTIFILFQSLLISIKVFISQEIYTLTDEPVDMKTCQALADYAHYLFTNVLIKFESHRRAWNMMAFYILVKISM